MRDLLLATVVFGLLPFVIKRPFWGILMLAWLGYMNPHLLCYGFMYRAPVVMIVAVVTMIGMLVSKEAKQMVWSREVIVLIIFIAWMAITTTQAFYFDPAVDQLIKVIKIQILTAMALMMLTSRERIHQFIWIIVLSLGFYGLKGGIFTIVHGGVYRVQGPATSFIAGNNELALALVMTIPLIRFLHLQEKNKLIQMALAVSMPLVAIAAIGTQSRGALVGLALTGTMFWLKSRNKLSTAVLIGVAVLLVVSIMPEQWYQRMDTIDTYQQDDSAIGRLNAWGTAINVANHRVLGGGFEMWHDYVFALYGPDPNNVRDAHSIYFKVLGEHGYIGLFLFLLLLALTWFRCTSIIRIAKRRPDAGWARDLATMIQVSMIGYMSAGAFLGLSYFDYIYHLIVVAVVTHHLLTVSQPASNSVVRTGPRTDPSVSGAPSLRRP
jgi:putative inorganic carbon (HCO3(-)) transporter